MEEKLKDYFKRYPNSQEVYENNGVLFHTRGAADSYGNAKDTARHTREKEILKPIDKDPEELKEAAIQLLKESDLDKLEYKALKSLAADLQLKTSNQKAETIMVALIELQTTLNAE